MKNHLKRWGAVWILLLLFLGSWIGQFISQVYEVRADALEHGQKFMWSDFWPQFFSATFENHQSEFLQLAVQCLLVQSLWANRKLFTADGAADKDDIAELKAEIRALRDR